MFEQYTTEEDRAAIEKIVERADGLFRRAEVSRDRLDIDMDVSATHFSCPLRLADLAAADDFNFAHDILGIYRHMNRLTGKLEGNFLPRFAKGEIE